MNERAVIIQKYFRPRVHPNGFIQLDLTKDGTERLHIWSDEPIPRQETDNTIHDHIFDMKSTVLIGGLTNEIWSYTPNASGKYEIYRAEYSKKSESILVPTGERCDLLLASSYHVVAGGSYTLNAQVFHDTVWDTLAATHMRKSKPRVESPRIICPIETPPDNSFVRTEVEFDLILPFIERVLDASPEARKLVESAVPFLNF